MPYGVYEAGIAGEEVSSTYEGRHLAFTESQITHPSHPADGLVDKGDAVRVGDKIVGVAFLSALTATDIVPIDTEGIWQLSVVATHDDGASAVVVGDELFINKSTCIISKIRNIATQIPFGYALYPIAAGTDVIPVKVHFDPTVDSQVSMFNTTISGGYGKSMRATLAGGASEGLSDYQEGHITANISGHTFNHGSWINVDAQNVLKAGHIIAPYDGGVWTDTTQTEARVVFGGLHQAILAGVPLSMHAWRLNVAQVAGPITALIEGGNPESIGYIDGVEAGTQKGWIKFATCAGVAGTLYVKVYSAM